MRPWKVIDCLLERFRQISHCGGDLGFAPSGLDKARGKIATETAQARYSHSGRGPVGDNERFVQLIGQPPMQYLKRWRLRRAAAALKDSRRPVAALAEEYGYESESSFNRAFKREFGMPPAAWRRKRVPGARTA